MLVVQNGKKNVAESRKPWIFTLGLVSPVFIQLDGRLFLIDIFALGFLFILILKKQMLIPKSIEFSLTRIRYFGFATLAMLTAISITDISKNVPLIDTFKGALAYVVLFSLSLFFIRLGTRQIKNYILGWSIGSALWVAIYFEVESSYYWKSQLGLSISIITIVLLSNSSFKNLIPWLLIAYSVISLYNSARSLAAIQFISATLILLFGNRKERSPTENHVIIFTFKLLLVAVSGIAFLSFYSNAANSGLLGSKNEETFQTQSRSTLPTVIMNRYEFLYYKEVLLESPLFGMGTNAKVPLTVADKINLNLSSVQIRTSQDIYSEPTIPIHSYIFSGWVFYGLFGLLYWLSILFLIESTLLRTLVNSMKSDYFTKTIISFLGVYFTWEMFFSPFGSTKRVTLALIISFALQTRINRRMKYNKI